EEEPSISSDSKKKIDNLGEMSFSVPKITLEEILATEKQKKKEIDLSFHFRRPSKIFEIPENLGNPPNLENPVAFEMVFKSIYQFISKEIHNMALKLDE
ncbi:MAG: hypothetical protein ACTSYC_04975, partial [Promethearchaeota archaeon]